MGLILDSSIVIKAERRSETVVQLLRRVAWVTGDQRVALTAVGLTELVHAIYRTQDPVHRQNHEHFIIDLLAEMEVIPYRKVTALLAGRIDGEQRAKGVSIPFADLLIGATALEYGYALATANPRHFQMIPGLQIVQL
jgi:predicted nucleic acid-binding protein